MTHEALAAQMQVDNPELIAALMLGEVKYPFSLVLPAAKALELDALKFFLLVLRERNPEIALTFEAVFLYEQQRRKQRQH